MRYIASLVPLVIVALVLGIWLDLSTIEVAGVMAITTFANGMSRGIERAAA